MKRLLVYSAAAVAAAAVCVVVVFPDLVFHPTALPTPPPGFDVRRDGVEHGRVETVEYESKTAGRRRKMCVYTPPGFARERTYPVLYLLHGSMADETSWVKGGRADVILDNLYAERRAVPMIVVMPNGNVDPAAEVLRHATADFDALEAELLGDVIPYVEKHYPVAADRDHRALAGLSSGASDATKIALTHADAFAYLGLFIGGLQTCAEFERRHQALLRDWPAKNRFTLVWAANGRYDLSRQYCQETLDLFDRHGIPYVYVEGQGLHNMETARNDLVVFLPLLFRGAR